MTGGISGISEKHNKRDARGVTSRFLYKKPDSGMNRSPGNLIEWSYMRLREKSLAMFAIRNEADMM